MYIGEVSKQTGLSVKAIRLYEDMGLIRTPPRQGRYRVYTDTDIEVLRLIAEAKQLGVTLNRLKGVIHYHQGEADWGRIHRFLLEVRETLLAEQVLLTQKIQQVEQCLQSMNDCPKTSLQNT
ncbi:MerR family transcriptional regulator [Photobacterium galatheae]|uniref:Transcriptional regulator n=1 Tax=Photobacterium galatheae TaxID=1654360 RepID=A0A066S1M9_9GAMM|nr:MerR family transcriptional regulator [Photobacterium galatheae]KDM93548.1 transcriptional regulator [Photobacterium galatheae]MCM0151372.1 MerR family transcriptional regulator [Photobacterium galatheae]